MVSVLDIVEELVSELPAVLEELGEPDAPMLVVLLLPPLWVLFAVLSVLGEVVLLVLGEAVLLPAAPALGEELLLVLGELLLVSVLELELPEVWAIARPTPPARAAAVARVVRLFLTFMWYSFDMKPRSEKRTTAGTGWEEKCRRVPAVFQLRDRTLSAKWGFGGRTCRTGPVTTCVCRPSGRTRRKMSDFLVPPFDLQRGVGAFAAKREVLVDSEPARRGGNERRSRLGTSGGKRLLVRVGHGGLPVLLLEPHLHG